MENFCRGLGWGMVAGVVIGGVLVAKNKKLANKIKEGLCTAEDKIEEVKDNIAEKLQQNDCCSPLCDQKPKDKNNQSKN